MVVLAGARVWRRGRGGLLLGEVDEPLGNEKCRNDFQPGKYQVPPHLIGQLMRLIGHLRLGLIMEVRLPELLPVPAKRYTSWTHSNGTRQCKGESVFIDI